MNLIARKLLAMAMVLTMVVGISATALADEKQAIKVQINGVNLEMKDNVPVLKGSSVFIPMRVIFENLGAEVTYEQATSTVIATRGTEKVAFIIGEKEFTVDKNGTTNVVSTDTPSYIENGTTFVPVRFVAEVFGATVNWDSAVQTVVIVDTAKMDTVNSAASKELSDEEYVAKVKELYTAMQAVAKEYTERVNQTDFNQVYEASKAMIIAIRPYYEEFTTLKTSGQYKEAQEQIATGATACLKMLDLTLEVISLSQNAENFSESEIMKITEELQAQAEKYIIDAKLLITGLTTVIGEME